MLNPDRKYSLCIDPENYEPESKEWKTLTDLADIYKTDKGNIKHNYTNVYEKYIKQDTKDLLEIGVACGASLKMWNEYLPAANITGLDIRPECMEMCKGYDRIGIVINDATTWIPDSEYDVIIDDGSHVSLDIINTFNNLWPKVKKGGLYFIEDMKCTHNPEYPKLVKFTKEPSAFWRRHIISWLDKHMVEMDWRKSDIEYIHYYKELMVIKKHD
jgi:trans-aconitate methyltransferase